MKKLFCSLLGLFITVQSSFGFLVNEVNYSAQVSILNSLDIETNFIKDPIYFSIKNEISANKTKNFLKILENGHRFVPLIRQMIKEADIPDVFLYLAMVESSLSPQALSKAKAVGLWQIMEPTAIKLGLKVDMYVDERKDLILSTDAAIKHLKQLNKKFGKWYLAAIAYNCGEGRLKAAIEKAKSEDISVLLDPEKKYLPKETRIYLRKIITMAHISEATDTILNNDAQYLMNQGSGFNIAKVKVPSGTSLAQIAKSIDISYEQIKEYNNHLKYPFTPPTGKDYHVYIPGEKNYIFASNFKPDLEHSFYVHEVKKGDTLYELAKEHGINYQIIKDYNNLKSNILTIKQELIIPSKNINREYIINQGDTLSHISYKFNIKVNEIMKINNLKSAMIKPGAKLVIPR